RVGIFVRANQQVVIAAGVRRRPTERRDSIRSDRGLHQLLQRERFFVGGLGIDDRRDRIGPVLALVIRDDRRRAPDTFAPGLGHQLVLGLHQRRREARLGLQRGETVTALVAHPIAVDAGVEARLEAIDASAMVVDVDRAATLASAAYR